jgi:hypothetical protein
MGLLIGLPHKTCDTIAHAAPGTGQQQLEEFLTNRHCDEESLSHQRAQKVSTAAEPASYAP